MKMGQVIQISRHLDDRAPREPLMSERPKAGGWVVIGCVLASLVVLAVAWVLRVAFGQ